MGTRLSRTVDLPRSPIVVELSASTSAAGLSSNLSLPRRFSKSTNLQLSTNGQSAYPWPRIPPMVVFLSLRTITRPSS